MGTYRPFTHQHVYFDRGLNDMVYKVEDLFPTLQHRNLGFYTLNPGAAKPFSVLMSEELPDLALYGSNPGQFFARWRYESLQPDDGMLALGSVEGEVVDG